MRSYQRAVKRVVKVRVVAGSVVVSLPKDLLERSGIGVGDLVSVSAKSGVIEIRVYQKGSE